MIFFISNRKLHLFDNVRTFKTQNTENNYMYVENYIYVAVEISKKNKQKTLHKKLSFPLKISSVNATKSAVSCGFGQIY